MNTIGQIFRLTCAGESHGPAIVGIVDGMPAGIPIDEEFIAAQMARRRPGRGRYDTTRSEADNVEFLSGIYNGMTLGTPIAFMIRNTDHHSADYDVLEHAFRPSHADYTYQMKYGIRDHRGGGRASARVTAAWVVAGALAMTVLRTQGISVSASIDTIGPFEASDPRAAALLEEAKAKGDTVGGVIAGTVKGLPAGVGEPVFGKLQAQLGHALLSINAVKGVEFGMGFEGVRSMGSEVIDCPKEGTTAERLACDTNFSGGSAGGISTGQDVTFRVAFKPIATLGMPVATVDDQFLPIELEVGGRHDTTALPRAVVIVESMAAIATLDMLLQSRVNRIC